MRIQKKERMRLRDEPVANSSHGIVINHPSLLNKGNSDGPMGVANIDRKEHFVLLKQINFASPSM
jgi:hypothetical protein